VLKKRIIPIQLLIDGRLVKTKQFGEYRDVGDPIASSRVYNAQNADELVFLNINRGQRSIEPLLPLLERVSEVCFMPLSLGGGIETLADAEVLIRHGADKVVVNSSVYRSPAIIEGIAGRFGAQAVIASVDARWSEPEGRYVLLSDCGRRAEAVTLEEHVKRCEERGAGELLINSIDRDGTMTGFDLRLIRAVAGACGLPVIACGGAGHYEHMREAFQETHVSALAVGSLFNFGDNNPIRAKAHLSNHQIAFKVV
jgi:cyclase